MLTPQEADDLFAAIRSFTAEGRSVIFISHKLREHRAIADRVSVLRRGRIVGTADPRTASEQDLADLMVGRPVDLTVHRDQATPGEVVLDVESLVVTDDTGARRLDGVDLQVRAGEIVAIAGVEGNGQTVLVRTVTGLTPATTGEVRISGEPTAGRSRKRVLRDGVGHIPEDRTRDGLVGEFSVAENLILDLWDAAPFARRRTLQSDTINEQADRLIAAYDIRTPSASTPVGTLSGGNQQKVVVAREFARPIDLLVASQPTRGVDVGSIEYIHKRIVEARDEGTAVLIVSSELDEVLALADRVAVMFQGRMVGPFDAPVAKDAIGRLMAGADPDDVFAGGSPRA